MRDDAGLYHIIIKHDSLVSDRLLYGNNEEHVWLLLVQSQKRIMLRSTLTEDQAILDHRIRNLGDC
jgi:hypothetical protein